MRLSYYSGLQAVLGESLGMGIYAGVESVSNAGSSARGGFHVGVVAREAAAIAAIRRIAEEQRPKWTLDFFAGVGAVLGTTKAGVGARGGLNLLLLVLDASGDAAAVLLQEIWKLPPALPVVVLGPRGSAASAVQWLLAGARGFLVQPVTPEIFAWALNEAAAGHAVLCAEAQHSMVSWLNLAGAAQELQVLSSRERQVLGWLTQPLYYKEVGERLGISTETVHALAKRIFKKLCVHSRRDAIRVLAAAGGGYT